MQATELRPQHDLPRERDTGALSMPCHAMPCHAMPCHAIPCHAMPSPLRSPILHLCSTLTPTAPHTTNLPVLAKSLRNLAVTHLMSDAWTTRVGFESLYTDIKILEATSPHHTSPHHTSPHLTSPHLTSPHHASPHLTSRHHASPQHTSPHHTSPHLTSPHLTMPHLTTPHLTTPHLTTPHLTTPHHTSPHLDSPHQTSPNLTSPHLTSPFSPTLSTFLPPSPSPTKRRRRPTRLPRSWSKFDTNFDHFTAHSQILLPSARHLEERLTVSLSGKQSVKQSVGQAGRQTGRQKHTVWLFSVAAYSYKQWGTVTSGQAVAQFLPDPCSNPSKHKFLTPPPNMVCSFRGTEASKSKNPLGDPFVGQNNGLQGVRHPISCLGVCYANDPQKGGCTASAPYALFEVISIVADARRKAAERAMEKKPPPDYHRISKVHGLYGISLSDAIKIGGPITETAAHNALRSVNAVLRVNCLGRIINACETICHETQGKKSSSPQNLQLGPSRDSPNEIQALCPNPRVCVHGFWCGGTYCDDCDRGAKQEEGVGD